MLCSVVLCSVQLRVYMDLVCMASAHGIVVAHRIRSLWVQWTYNESGSCSCKREEWWRTEELKKQQQRTRWIMCAQLWDFDTSEKLDRKVARRKKRRFESRQTGIQPIYLRRNTRSTQYIPLFHCGMAQNHSTVSILVCVFLFTSFNNNNRPLNYSKCSWSHRVELLRRHNTIRK